MIDELFKQHNFDPTLPGQILIVEHAESTGQYRVAPLTVITTEDGYKVSRAIRREARRAIEELIAAHYLGTEAEHHRPE